MALGSSLVNWLKTIPAAAGAELKAVLDVTTVLSSDEAAVIDGVTPGTAAAGKAVVLDSSSVIDAFTVTDLTVANDLTMSDAGNIIVNATTGSQIATAVTQKLGFWGTTPVVQPAAAGQAAVAAPTAYSAHGSGGTTVTSNAATDLDTTAAALATLVTEMTSLRTLVDAMRTAMVNTGIMKGSS